jgi:hypothetical protein
MKKKAPKKSPKKAIKKTSGKKSASSVGKCGKWKAIHDFMPPGPARLSVTGVCTFPTPGFKVTLKRHVPQGINPAILLLDKTVKRPTGIEPQIVTQVAVKFEARTNTRYTTVSILPDGVQIKVQNVH